MKIPEDPCHIRPEPAHGLHPFRVFGSFAGSETVSDVPILRTDDDAVEHLERHEETLQRRGRTAAAADRHARDGFAGHARRIGHHRPLDQRQQRPVGLSVIDRRADDDRIGFGDFFHDFVARIVVEDAAAGFFAGVAGHAAVDGLSADPEIFDPDIRRAETFRDFRQ